MLIQIQKVPLFVLLFGLANLVTSIALNYEYEYAPNQFYRLPYGQYIFFSILVSVASARLINFRIDKKNIKNEYYFLVTCFLLLFLGVLVSGMNLETIRLFLIITSVSISSIILGAHLRSLYKDSSILLYVLLILPYCFPVFSAVFLEFTGAWDFGVLIENKKHFDLEQNRWKFLSNSANGFGLNAAVALSTFCITAMHAQSRSVKYLMIICILISGFALVSSGTRAGYLFTMSSLLVYFLFFVKPNILRWSVTVVASIIFLLAVIVIFKDGLIEAFRLEGNIDQISSARWDSMIKMSDLIITSPLIGLGFGAMDNSFHIVPNNLFYHGIFLEVGLFGFIGVIGILIYPLFTVFNSAVISHSQSNKVKKNLIYALSLCLFLSFFPYLIFEFKVMRVSSFNHLFFLFWGVLAFSPSTE